MGSFRFRQYESAELEACGHSLCSDLLQNYPRIDEARDGTTAWTEYVMGWFKESAASGLTTYHKWAHGEFMLDLVHATWTAQESWQAAVTKPCRVVLALECEWGKKHSKQGATEEILKD